MIAIGHGHPSSLALGLHEDLYVADPAYNKIRKVAPNGIVTSVGKGFAAPMGVTADIHGNVFVADTSNNAIKKVTPKGTISVVGHGFREPQDVAVDTSGNVYVADTLNNAVKKVAPDGTITTIASGSAFASPYRLAIRAGNVYAATVQDRNSGSDFLWKIAPNGRTVGDLGSVLDRRHRPK